MQAAICKHGINSKDCSACPVSYERSHYLTTVEWFNLNTNLDLPCKCLGIGIYLVGSALKTRNFRDVDLRCIPYEEDEKFFEHPVGTFLQVTIGEWLSNRTGLTIDFQFQTMKEAQKFDGDRIAMGMSL